MNHKTTCTDEQVRGHRGAVARCECGWKAEWRIRDGSAEADAHMHMMANDVEYREDAERRIEAWKVEMIESGCVCKLLAFSYAVSQDCPLHRVEVSRAPAPKRHEHNCSCHISPPCSACEHCGHWDNPDCENDCWDCWHEEETDVD